MRMVLLGIATALAAASAPTIAAACARPGEHYGLELESVTRDGAALADLSAYERYDVMLDTYGSHISWSATAEGEEAYHASYSSR